VAEPDDAVGAAFQAMARGEWAGARDAFSDILEVADVQAFGLASVVLAR
jgi:hypothetical protein